MDKDSWMIIRRALMMIIRHFDKRYGVKEIE